MQLVAGPPTTGPTPFPALTNREHDILSMLAAGYQHRHRRTAAAQRKDGPELRLHRPGKLEVTTRAEAERRAREAGLSDTDR